MPPWSWSWRTLTGHPKVERRVAPRLPAARVTSCLVIALPNHVPLKVQIRDLSLSGIGLINDSAVENGTFLVVTLRASRKFERVVRARVVHSTEQPDGNWLLGCALSRSLTSEELDAFR